MPFWRLLWKSMAKKSTAARTRHQSPPSELLALCLFWNPDKARQRVFFLVTPVMKDNLFYITINNWHN